LFTIITDVYVQGGLHEHNEAMHVGFHGDVFEDAQRAKSKTDGSALGFLVHPTHLKEGTEQPRIESAFQIRAHRITAAVASNSPNHLPASGLTFIAPVEYFFEADPRFGIYEDERQASCAV
jgi:hypothetical protein